MTVFRVFFSVGVMVILPWNQINRGRNFSVNLMFIQNSGCQRSRQDQCHRSLETSAMKQPWSWRYRLNPNLEVGPSCCEYTVWAFIHWTTGTPFGMALIIFDTPLTPSSKALSFYPLGEKMKRWGYCNQRRQSWVPAYLARPGTCFDVILWCIARQRPVPKSARRLQLSDRLPFITVTSLRYLITFLELFQAWECFSQESEIIIPAFFAPSLSLTQNENAPPSWDTRTRDNCMQDFSWSTG